MRDLLHESISSSSYCAENMAKDMHNGNYNNEVNEKCVIVYVLQHKKCECKACQNTQDKEKNKKRISKQVHRK